MSEQENIKIAHMFFDNFNAHNLDWADGIVTDDYRAEGPGAAGPMTREQVKMQNQGFLTAFPDLHFEVTLTLSQGDYVVLHWVGTGSHTGPLPTPSGGAIPPTGKKATVSGSVTYQFRGSKVARAWNFWDMASLLGQLGLLPPM